MDCPDLTMRYRMLPLEVPAPEHFLLPWCTHALVYPVFCHGTPAVSCGSGEDWRQLDRQLERGAGPRETNELMQRVSSWTQPHMNVISTRKVTWQYSTFDLILEMVNGWPCWQADFRRSAANVLHDALVRLRDHEQTLPLDKFTYQGCQVTPLQALASIALERYGHVRGAQQVLEPTR